MGEVGQHVRLPAWGSRRRTCVKSFDFPPICRLNSSRQGVAQGTVLIRGLLSAQRKELEHKRRWRGDEKELGEMNVSKTDAGVPRMSQQWKRPVISPEDGFRVRFSSCKLSGYVWVCSSLHVYLCVREDWRGQCTTDCLHFKMKKKATSWG